MENIKENVTRAAESMQLSPIKFYDVSFQQIKDTTVLLAKTCKERRLFSTGPCDMFSGDKVEINGISITVCKLTHENAVALRKLFPWTGPIPVGLKTSFGTGDRIGVATPGHICALKPYDVVPVLAQQSIREMTRTGRTPEQVMDDATWAVFQEGYTGGFGSDADHLKTEQDIRNTVAAGFTGFTVDPSDHINNDADTMDTDTLQKAYEKLFDSKDEANAFLLKYSKETAEISGIQARLEITISEEDTKRLAVKYLPAIRHTIYGYDLLTRLLQNKNFDFEMSVDETETPTTVAAHYMVARELKDADVICTSLAPRFVGEFQKAIDYIGDIDAFRKHLKDHVTIAQHFGPYKISIHSGSDKFSIFPVIGQETNGLFHEKTAGTSYLEALRVIARHDPELFRNIFQFARTRFQKERHSYHVTTNMAQVPDITDVNDRALEGLLDQDDSRQVLHITFGGTLTARNDDGSYRFRDSMLNVLNEHEEDYYQFLEKLFVKHAQAFEIKKKS